MKEGVRMKMMVKYRYIDCCTTHLPFLFAIAKYSISLSCSVLSSLCRRLNEWVHHSSYSKVILDRFQGPKTRGIQSVGEKMDSAGGERVEEAVGSRSSSAEVTDRCCCRLI